MIKRYTSNIYVDFYIHAARKLGIKYELLPNHKTTFLLRKNKKTLFISNAVLGVNDFLSHNITRNKYRTYQLFDIKRIPHPNAIKITSYNNVRNKIKALKKPLVVKPAIGSGGFGVTVKLSNLEKIMSAIKIAKEYHNEIIIEEFVKGENFRILIFRKKILDIVKRIPANIIGNGEDTIKKLINNKNYKRKIVGLKKIKIDNELNKELEKNKLTLQSIPKKDVIIFLRRNCNMATGGETIRIPIKTVHRDNKRLFIESANFLNLEFAGIDFISNDIIGSYKVNHSFINEINRFPSLDVHYFADMKMDNTIAEKLLSTYFNI